jgi:hypothetical protein
MGGFHCDDFTPPLYLSPLLLLPLQQCLIDFVTLSSYVYM